MDEKVVDSSENSKIISAATHSIPPTAGQKSDASNSNPISKQSHSIKGRSKSEIISEEIIFHLIENMKLPK